MIMGGFTSIRWDSKEYKKQYPSSYAESFRDYEQVKALFSDKESFFEFAIENPELWDFWKKKDFIDYETYIKSPEWKAKALYAKRRAGYRCQVCNRQEKTEYEKDTNWFELFIFSLRVLFGIKQQKQYIVLHAHHRTYARLGCELPEDITVLCAECHELFTKHYSYKSIMGLFIPKKKDVAIRPLGWQNVDIDGWDKIKNGGEPE